MIVIRFEIWGIQDVLSGGMEGKEEMKEGD